MGKPRSGSTLTRPTRSGRRRRPHPPSRLSRPLGAHLADAHVCTGLRAAGGTSPRGVGIARPTPLTDPSRSIRCARAPSPAIRPAPQTTYARACCGPADRGGARSTTALAGREGGGAPRPGPLPRPAPPPPRPRPHLTHRAPRRCSGPPLAGHPEELKSELERPPGPLERPGAADQGGAAPSRPRPGTPAPRRPAPEPLAAAAHAFAHFTTVDDTVAGGEGAQSTTGSVGDP